MSMPTWRRATLAWTLAMLAALPAAAQEVSPAETLLFQTKHLQNVDAPSTLTYAFHKEGSVEPGFDDRVTLVIADATPAATLQFLTGPRHYTTPAVDQAEGNPVLLGFLEHDIAEMQRLTGGATAYFRKRIRLALAESAQVGSRRFTYAGKTIEGREIVIVPYQNDPMHARFERFTGKRYTFVVSPQVPGGVYQMRAAADGDQGHAALIDETLTLVDAAGGQR